MNYNIHSSNHAAKARLLLVQHAHAASDDLHALLELYGYQVSCARDLTEARKTLGNTQIDLIITDFDQSELEDNLILNDLRSLAPSLPVIFLASHHNSFIMKSVLDAGIADVVLKPSTYTELPVMIERNIIRHQLAHHAQVRYEQEIRTSCESILNALLSALNVRDMETEGHSERVTAIALILADLLGTPKEQMHHIERGALLHDIGKIGVPDRILLKPGPLTEEEWVEMRRHPEIGFRLCSRIDFLKIPAQIVLHHHERWDGTGYPDGLREYEIPLGARIFSVADALDAMMTDRPYAPAQSTEQAVQEILACAGKQFDPQIVEAFLSIPLERWERIRSLGDADEDAEPNVQGVVIKFGETDFTR
jgi:putative nucleotidyltransferase with HDIG domain